ncbi:UDP-glycosyltransferase 13-like [Syzygium oleosum]|uniref:UDP-glycosyltransferase 13-like n=1 Tax=Syzygium oleosum TaxID=219896 RepID=UPI0024B93610|nr:UDP-glycosyltransferase 13-like [Syzygium oleosum]
MQSSTLSSSSEKAYLAMSTTQPPHIALFSGAEMGHLMPVLRLARMLAKRNCTVTVITAHPTVSAAESDQISLFLRHNPEINHLELHLAPSSQQEDLAPADPFFLQFDLINHSVHLLRPLLSSSSPPFSAMFVDFFLVAKTAPIAKELHLPVYVVSTTSVECISLMAYFPVLTSNPTEFNNASTEIKIPGLPPMAMSSLPPALLNPGNLFTSMTIMNSQALSKADGILTNTFEYFQASTLGALNKSRVTASLPPILPIGPLEPYHIPQDGDHRYRSWLENQPSQSVVYISFGSRTAISRDQVQELESGLEKAGRRFCWNLKNSIVDKDDREDVKDILSNLFLERTKNKGMIIRGWTDQQEILAHPAIGGFVSHCGWNSVMEAAWQGVPVLAWPQNGDQRLNAKVVEDAGLGLWERNWDWGVGGIVKGDEIERKIVELMTDEKLRERAKKVREEARKAVESGGSSDRVIGDVINSLILPYS